jgi:hypothetical protein
MTYLFSDDFIHRKIVHTDVVPILSEPQCDRLATIYDEHGKYCSMQGAATTHMPRPEPVTMATCCFLEELDAKVRAEP